MTSFLDIILVWIHGTYWFYFPFSFTDASATFDIEITKRSNKNYVLVPLSSFPALSAFTISLFVSFTDPGSKTYFNYYRPRSFNEIFIYERNNHFIINLKQNVRYVYCNHAAFYNIVKHVKWKLGLVIRVQLTVKVVHRLFMHFNNLIHSYRQIQFKGT